MKARFAVAVGVFVIASGALVASGRPDPAFPHREHERVFPVCEGCHAGVVTGVADDLYPEPAACARCHDGQRVPAVEWSPPGPRASNLRFFHPDHRGLVEAAGEAANCVSCHAAGDPPTRMNVAAASPGLCLGCHAHAAEVHLAETVECTRCHVPLPAASRVPAQKVAAFPRPASHDAEDFLSRHAPDTPQRETSCAVCHARETCERCHVNADRLPQVLALARDDRVAALEHGRTAEYPTPPSHLDSDWGRVHGAAARAEPARCSNCHTGPSCAGCHREVTGQVATVLGSLPAPAPGRAAGVNLTGAAERVHPGDFSTRHGVWAASGTLQCAQCHSQQYCSDCHAGADSRRFHAPNFVERHAPDAFASTTECQSCHSTETFCLACHSASGLASGGRMTAAFHTGKQLWVLSHGQAARRGLESCASCHSQNDCTQCHSAAGGWGVNPHGPGFAASRLAARNRISCQWCHLGDPGRRD